jgi:hypothetical protein
MRSERERPQQNLPGFLPGLTSNSTMSWSLRGRGLVATVAKMTIIEEVQRTGFDREKKLEEAAPSLAKVPEPGEPIHRY